MSSDPRRAIAVFRGTRAACFEHRLVLEAQGVAYDLTELDGMWALMVPPAAVDLARDELTRYAAERRTVREAPAAIIPFGGAAIGAAGYAIVLLLTAYCAGIQWLGIDWLESGALDARPGGASEWWRPVTALTLHLDQAHLLSNLLFGAGFGILAGRVLRPRRRLGEHRRGRCRGELPGHADLTRRASRGRRFHRGVCRPRTACRLFLAPAADAARAVPVSLGAAVRGRVPAGVPGCRRGARRCARPCTRIRGRYRARLGVCARPRAAQPRQRDCRRPRES